MATKHRRHTETNKHLLREIWEYRLGAVSHKCHWGLKPGLLSQNVTSLVHIFKSEMALQKKCVEIRKWVGFPYKVDWRYMPQAYENIRDKNNALSLYKNSIL